MMNAILGGPRVDRALETVTAWHEALCMKMHEDLGIPAVNSLMMVGCVLSRTLRDADRGMGRRAAAAYLRSLAAYIEARNDAALDAAAARVADDGNAMVLAFAKKGTVQ